MSILLTLLPAIVSLISSFFGSSWGNLANVSISAVEAIIAELKNGGNSLTSTITSILQELITEAQAVQQVGGLSTEQDAVLTESVAVITAALQGVASAEAGADPSTLPVPPAVA
jgi:hypothetical protein